MTMRSIQFGGEADHRTVLITGAAGTLGREVAERLGLEGYAVAVHYHQDVAAAQKLVDRLKANGADAALCQGDLACPQDVSRLVGDARRNLGEPNVLIHNASPPIHSVPWDESLESFHHFVAVYVDGFVNLAKALLPSMKRRQQGLIIGVLTEAIEPPVIPEWAAYAAAKAAFASYLHSLSSHVEGTDIRIAGIYPGRFSAQPNNAGRLTPQATPLLQPRWTIGMAPSDVASVILRIVSQPGRYPNGSEVAINAIDGERSVGPFGVALRAVETAPGGAAESTQPPDRALVDNLKAVFKRVLGLPDDTPFMELSMQSLLSWDSITHVKLMLEIEDAFDLQLKTEDVLSMTTFSAIVKRLSKQAPVSH